MYASIFFFAAWGPLSTTFILPAELFPSSWRVTGYGLCAATGSLGSVVGIWIFVYARHKPIIYPLILTHPYTHTTVYTNIHPYHNNTLSNIATGSLGSVVGIWIFVYARYTRIILIHLATPTYTHHTDALSNAPSNTPPIPPSNKYTNMPFSMPSNTPSLVP